MGGRAAVEPGARLGGEPRFPDEGDRTHDGLISALAAMAALVAAVLTAVACGPVA